MKLIDKKMVYRCGMTIVVIILLQACTTSYFYMENAMPEPIKLSPRMQLLFSKTKLVCFGRYALEVPQEAQLIMGTVGAPSNVIISDKSRELLIAADIKRIKENKKTTIFAYNDKGPVDESWQIRYYDSKAEKNITFISFEHT